MRSHKVFLLIDTLTIRHTVHKQLATAFTYFVHLILRNEDNYHGQHKQENRRTYIYLFLHRCNRFNLHIYFFTSLLYLFINFAYRFAFHIILFHYFNTNLHFIFPRISIDIQYDLTHIFRFDSTHRLFYLLISRILYHLCTHCTDIFYVSHFIKNLSVHVAFCMRCFFLQYLFQNIQL